MPLSVESLLQQVSRLKLRGGLVGKVCTVLIVVAPSMAAIAWAVKLPWVSVLALLLVFGLAIVILWRLISFADRNPQAAILEGAEFVVLEQLRLGTKQQPILDVGPGERTLRELPTVSPAEAARPDPPDLTGERHA